MVYSSYYLCNKAANTLNGQNGNYKLYGVAGNYVQTGGIGNDLLYGGSDNDMLIDGLGRCRVWGQGGRDTFLVQRGSGYIIIEDFTKGQARIQHDNCVSGLQLKTSGDDMLKLADLIAVDEDSAGDL